MTSAPRELAPGLAHTALSLRAHDRVGSRRADGAWLDEVWGDGRTRVLVLSGARLRVDRPEDGGRAGLTWVSPSEAPDGERILLGERDGVVHLAVQAGTGLAKSENAAEPEHPPWLTLREVVAELDGDDAPLAVHAVGLAEWRRVHRFCPLCAGELRAEQAGHVLVCASCGRQQFPRTDPAVIMVVTDGERCLLGHQPSWPEGRYSTLAGFVEPGESMEDAVRREVAEETGIAVGDVDYVGNQPWPFPASLMVGFVAHAVSTDIEVDGEEISDAAWFTREQLRERAEEGSLVLPGPVSISRSLIELWYGGELPGSW